MATAPPTAPPQPSTGRRTVVVTGLGVVCAAGRDTSEFWARLMSGRTAISEVLDPAFDVFEARFAGQVPDAWLHDALGEEDRDLDRFVQLALVAGRQAMTEAAGTAGRAASAVRSGLVLGQCQSNPVAGNDGAVSYRPMHYTCDVLAERLDVQGPRILLSTACAAGGNVVGMARDKLLSGEADVMLAGGVDPLLFGTYAGFGGMHALSDRLCSPYARSDGLNLGEGAAFLVLEPLDLAVARGATALAEIAGYGLSADAYHATAPDPTGRGGASAMRRALADAGLAVGDVDYVSGHGTGTPANDSMERKVMRSVFDGRADTVPMSSIKSFVGHTLGAAGAIEAVTSVLAIKHGVAPPTANVAVPAAQGDLDIVANEARPMTIDVVLSNNYAFGGNNVSLALTSPGIVRARAAAPAPTEVVISGLGPVGAPGIGVDQWRQALAGGAGCARRDDGGHWAAEVPSLDGRTFAPRSLWRHMNALSRWAIAASRLAWEDAGLVLGRTELDEVGLIYATAAGSAESVGGFDESVASDPQRPAVLSFANVVLNATGGAVCQTLGLRGPTTTICHGGASASLAVQAGVETIQAGKADVVLVVAADEHGASHRAEHAACGRQAVDGIVRPYGRDRSGTVLGSGALTLVLESAGHCAARGGRLYGTVTAVRHASQRRDETGQGLVERSMQGLLRDDLPIGLVVGAADGGPDDSHEAAALDAVLRGAHTGARVMSASAHLGSVGAVSGAAAIATAALSLLEPLGAWSGAALDPEHGPADRYSSCSGGDLPAAVLALTAAPGSVRGGVLLSGAR